MWETVWRCNKCQIMMIGNSGCTNCKSDKNGNSSFKPIKKSDEWECSDCKTVNSDHKTECLFCEQ